MQQARVRATLHSTPVSATLSLAAKWGETFCHLSLASDGLLILFAFHDEDNFVLQGCLGTSEAELGTCYPNANSDS